MSLLHLVGEDFDAVAERMAENLDGQREHSAFAHHRGDDRLEACPVCHDADNRKCCSYGRDLPRGDELRARRDLYGQRTGNVTPAPIDPPPLDAA